MTTSQGIFIQCLNNASLNWETLFSKYCKKAPQNEGMMVTREVQVENGFR